MTKTWSKVLEEDLQWREAELASLKRLAVVNADNKVVFRTLLRSSWALLYAHYEGFTKFCWELLFDEVQKEGIKVSELSDNFKVIALEKDFQKFRGNLESSYICEFIDSTYPELANTNANFHSDYRLKTESNLWPNIYERECSRIGIDCSQLDSSRSKIKTLVARRNEIAHGKKMVIENLDEYTPYETTTLTLMHDLAIQLVDVLDEKRYKI